MNNDANKDIKLITEARTPWYESKVVSIIMLLAVIGIITGVFIFAQQNPDKLEELKDFGYLGAFIVSIVLNATVVLPAGNFVVLMGLGTTDLSPWLIGLSGGLGAAIGELTGYAAGFSGRGIIQKQKLYGRLEGWVKKWGMQAIFVLSVIPFVFDLAGMAAGVLRFPIWKFFVATWAGRTVLYIIIAWVGALGWEFLGI